jgi:hypothetical protein
MPAVSQAFMRCKGPNARCTCRVCQINAVRNPTLPGQKRPNTLYTPLHRPLGYPEPQSYDPYKLPLRTHAKYLQQANEVRNAPSIAKHDCLSTIYGINGVPLLSTLSSLDFPRSFPYDFMHLITNILESLIDHWTHNFKGLDEGSEEYEIPPSVWAAVGEATLNSNKSIPSAFGRKILNIAEDRAFFTSEAWIIWSTLLGPVLLCRRFKRERYYDHFVLLVKIILCCLEFEIMDEEIDKLQSDIVAWVEGYEK